MPLQDIKNIPRIKSTFDSCIEKLIMEMPQMVHGELGYIDNRDHNAAHLDYIKRTWEFLENTTIANIPVEVWMNRPRSPDVELVFIDEHQQILARVEFDYIEENSIQMVYIWQQKHARGFMYSIFLEYLLPRYDAIISDSDQTIKGFRFYHKMFAYAQANGLSFSILDGETGKEYPINNVSQMNDYFGDDTHFQRYRFKISKYGRETTIDK